MTDADLAERYRRYIGCLNERRLDALVAFVHDRVIYNGATKTRAKYQSLIAESIAAAPDLRFDIGLFVVEGDMVAAKLDFDCRPHGSFIGLETEGRPARSPSTILSLHRRQDSRSVVVAR